MTRIFYQYRTTQGRIVHEFDTLEQAHAFYRYHQERQSPLVLNGILQLFRITQTITQEEEPCSNLF